MASSSSNAKSGVHPPRPRFWSKSPTFATLFAGPEKERFVVHDELLICYSPFFRAALTGKFKEAEERAINLDWNHLDSVEFFVHWLYHRHFPDKIPDEYPEILEKWENDDDLGARKVEQLIYLYVFCDKYDIPKLMLACIDELFYMFETEHRPDHVLPNANVVRVAFESLPETSPLRQFLVDMHCRWDNPRNYVEKGGFQKQDWPKEFLVEVMQGYCQMFGDQSPHNRVLCCEHESGSGWCSHRHRADLEVCEYHGHITDEEKEACPGSGWGEKY